jgi:hypothetical protein
MPEPIDLAEARKEMKRDYADMRQLRKELIWSVPITDKRITKLDMRLMEHPLTDLSLLFEIYSRVMYVSAATYAVEATPDQKRLELLRLREHYREFCKLPERMQEMLGPLWSEWVDALAEEERELKLREECYGTA